MANLNINKVTLGGRLTADVELKQTQEGNSVCSFTIAITRRSNRKITDFINCVAWGKTAELICQYMGKGSSILIVGELQVRCWQDPSGQKRYATETNVDEVYFVDSKSGSEQAGLSAEFEEIPTDEKLPF